MAQNGAGVSLLGLDAAFGAPLLDALDDLVVAYDAGRTARPVIWANRALINALGRDPEGEPLGAVLGGAAADVIDQANGLRVGSSATAEANVHLGGTHATARAMHTRVARPAADVVVWIGTDHTTEQAADRVRTDRLTAHNEELKRSNFDLDQFAFVASHDLVEPLRMVTAYLDLIAELYGDALDDKGHQYLGFALDGATRMRSLVDDLLTLARVNGPSGARREPVALESVLAETIQTLAPALADSGADLHVSPGLPTVQGDRRQLVQLFVNLVSNALKFTSPDRPNTVTVAVDQAPVDPHDTTHGTVRITITDAGIGIDADQRAVVFDMFRRLHPRTRYGGSGMGLAICKAIVERHGGHIGIDAAAGGGSVVWLTLPVAPAPQR